MGELLTNKTRIGLSAVLVALASGSTGCGPWLTPIPTYWPPQVTRYPMLARLPDVKPRAARPRPKPAPAKPAPARKPKVVIAKDTRKECLSIYTITSQRQLFAYSPMDNSFTLRGALQCPNTWSSPFSMAVNSKGKAHVLYSDGHLYEVDVNTAECKATPFAVNQKGFRRFGMAYGPSKDGKGEDLYVVEISFVKAPRGLARIDTSTFELEYIGPLSQNPGFAIELTPTGRGPLSGFFINRGTGGTLVDIDVASGRIASASRVDVGTGSSSLAVSWWGDAYYIFTQHWRGTQVSRYNPADKSVEKVTTLPQSVVGAGVSTCAPSIRNQPEPSGPSENGN